MSTYFWPYSVSDMLLTRFYVGLITLSLGEIVNTNCSTFTVVSLFYYKMMKAHRRDQAAIRQPAELLLLEESICTKGHFADLLISGWFLFMSLKEWWGYSGVVFTHKFVVKAAKVAHKNSIHLHPDQDDNTVRCPLLLVYFLLSWRTEVYPLWMTLWKLATHGFE